MRSGDVRALRSLEELSVFLSLWVLRVVFEGLTARQWQEEVAEGKGRAAAAPSLIRKGGRGERSNHGSTWASTFQLPMLSCKQLSAIPNKGLPVPGFHWVKAWLAVVLSKQCSVRSDDLLVKVTKPLSLLGESQPKANSLPQAVSQNWVYWLWLRWS